MKAAPFQKPHSAERHMAAAGSVSNTDVLTALLSMADGLRGVVEEAVRVGLKEELDRSLPDALQRSLMQSPVDPGSAAQPEPLPDIALERATIHGLTCELATLLEHIEATKEQIAALKPEGGHSGPGGVFDAAHELDEIVGATENATSTILEEAETLQQLADTLRSGAKPEDVADALEMSVTNIFTACSFQDLTGQRITKVVNTFQYIEDHIREMVRIWNIEQGTGNVNEMVNRADDNREDRELLHGPQLDGQGVSQSDIDALFG